MWGRAAEGKGMFIPKYQLWPSKRGFTVSAPSQLAEVESYLI